MTLCHILLEQEGLVNMVSDISSGTKWTTEIIMYNLPANFKKTVPVKLLKFRKKKKGHREYFPRLDMYLPNSYSTGRMWHKVNL